MTTLQSRMNRFDYEGLEIDVWPRVREAMTAGSPQPEPQRKPRFVLVLASLLVVWRLAQLSVDLPAPVVNSVVPLALMVLVLWKVTGDPFAIQVTALLSAVALYISLPKVEADRATLSDRIFLFDYLMVSIMIAITILRINPFVETRRWMRGTLGISHILIIPLVVAAAAFYVYGKSIAGR